MMTRREALEAIASAQANRSLSRRWARRHLADDFGTPLDFAYIPSSMGQGIALGLGLALARPHRGVIAIMGDGSLLMNLGALVTVANHSAPLHVVLIDNGLYEVTGGQPVAGAGRTDFAGFSKGGRHRTRLCLR